MKINESRSEMEDWHREALKIYRKDKLTLRQVAERYGVSKQYIHQIFTKFGVKTRNKAEAGRLRSKLAPPMPLCQCGCGKRLKDRRTKYLKGHWEPEQKPASEADLRAICLYERGHGLYRSIRQAFGLDPSQRDIIMSRVQRLRRLLKRMKIPRPEVLLTPCVRCGHEFSQPRPKGSRPGAKICPECVED